LRRTVASVPELANVLYIVTSDAATGAVMIGVADTVCFTSSVATGRVIARHCAERLIPVSLELGGKDTAIVLDGVDFARTARATAWVGSRMRGNLACRLNVHWWKDQSANGCQKHLQQKPIMSAKVMRTLLRGKTVFADGRVVGPAIGQYLKRPC
jgi:Aldehyde dehydrogenase family